MILLVTPHLSAGECVEAIRRSTNEDVVVAESLRKAATLLRSETYLAVVLDQFLLETESQETETIIEHLGTAIPLQMNLAICGVERVAREVRTAVYRRGREEAAARQVAVRTLHSELNGTVTAILLSCELALGTPGLPLEAAENLRSTHVLVKKLRSQLESGVGA